MSDIQAPSSASTDTSASVDSTESTENLESSEESSEESSAKPEVKAAPTSLKKKLKLKFDGKEEDLEFDPNDDDYLTKQFQLAKMGHKSAQELATIRKQVDEFVRELKKNPRKVLSDPNIGIDIKELAAQVIEEEIENSRKSPEQLEYERAQHELKALKEEREKEKAEFNKKELERIQNQEYERYDMLMTQALEKSDLPKSPYIIKKMADYMLLGLENNVDVSPTDIIPLVREEMQNDLKEMFSVMPDEVVEAIVGKDVINRIRKKNIAKAKSQPPVPTKASIKDIGLKSGKPEEETEKKQSFKQFFGV